MQNQIIETEHLEVVLKLTERCNINCSYCYVFNLGNDDYKEQASLMSISTAEEVAKFLVQGVADLSVKRVTIVFHGGEPMLMKKNKFIEICNIFVQSLQPLVELRLSIQTNAILVDDEWISIFEKYGVSVGVSVDGPIKFHDVHRIDHKGNGTYSKTIKGLEKIKLSFQSGQLSGFGALAVVNHEYDGAEVYRHLVHDLGFTHLNFLLPMDTHDQFDKLTSDLYSKYICDAFDAWVSDDNPKIKVRLFDQILRFFASGYSDDRMLARGSVFSEGVHISTNGDLGDDELKPTNFAQLVGNVRSMSLVDYLNSPELLYTHAVKSSVPTGCQECEWQSYCLGGAKNGIYSSRYSSENGFDNPSTICSSLKSIYSHLASYILNAGLDVKKLESRLLHRDPRNIPANQLPPINRVKYKIIPLTAEINI